MCNSGGSSEPWTFAFVAFVNVWMSVFTSMLARRELGSMVQVVALSGMDWSSGLPLTVAFGTGWEESSCVSGASNLVSDGRRWLWVSAAR